MTQVDLMIPYWGDPTYMRQTLTSVLAQTSAAWRLTIIDDAYPDPWLGAWIDELAHPSVRYVRKRTNEGLVANFRSCVQMAEAPLMAMIGSDDRLLPTYVESILRAHQAFPFATMIQPAVRVIDADGSPSSGLADVVKQRALRPRGEHPHVLAGEDLATSLLHGDWLYWPSLAFRTDAIQSVDFNDAYSIVLDLDVILALIERGASMLVWPEEVFEYRRHAQSESSASLLTGTRFAGEREFFGEVAGRMDSLGWRKAARAARWHITSRLHAATLAPVAARARSLTSLRTIARHTLGR